MKILIKALGCRTNLAEAEALSSVFLRRGDSVIDRGVCDAVIVVTCSVTAMADRKSRQLVYRLRREHPGAILTVCGCWAQGIPAEDAKAMGVNLLVGNRNKSQIPELIEKVKTEHLTALCVRGNLECNTQWDPLELDRPLQHSRAFLRVQDGCNRRCTYCIVPELRGPSVSRPLEDILCEAQRALSSGCRELVLTGVHLGLYGRDLNMVDGLSQLIRSVGGLTGISRLRFGSLEPFCIEDRLIETMAAVPSFCHHLHLPVQSGDNEILARMGRGYTAEDYLNLVEKLRRILGEDVHISTDVMVGFPGENDMAFRNTLMLLKEARIGRIHCFKYSLRRGTIAADMADQVPLQVSSERAEKLSEFGNRLLQSEAERWLGCDVPVLFEGGARGRSQGYTRQYLEFHLHGGSVFRREVLCRVEDAREGILYGYLA